MLHQEGPLHDQLIQQVYFSEKFCMTVLFFVHLGHLQALKVRDLRLQY
jgi:hypothetical protein